MPVPCTGLRHNELETGDDELDPSDGESEPSPCI